MGNGLNVQNIGSVMELLEANYGSRLYKDTNRKNVIALWTSMFQNDSPVEVLTAVKEYMEDEPFPPTVADIKRIMRQNRSNQPCLKSPDEIVSEANRLSSASRVVTPELKAKTAEKVKQFLVLPTEIEIKIVEKREESKWKRYL